MSLSSVRSETALRNRLFSSSRSFRRFTCSVFRGAFFHVLRSGTVFAGRHKLPLFSCPRLFAVAIGGSRMLKKVSYRLGSACSVLIARPVYQAAIFKNFALRFASAVALACSSKWRIECTEICR
jgi:hypothetical protein